GAGEVTGPHLPRSHRELPAVRGRQREHAQYGPGAARGVGAQRGARARRRRRARVGARARARPAHPRPRDAAHVGLRGVPRGEAEPVHGPHPGADAHGPERRRPQGAGLRRRRRRLPGQAVRPPRAARAGGRAAAPRAARGRPQPHERAPRRAGHRGGGEPAGGGAGDLRRGVPRPRQLQGVRRQLRLRRGRPGDPRARRHAAQRGGGGRHAHRLRRAHRRRRLPRDHRRALGAERGARVQRAVPRRGRAARRPRRGARRHLPRRRPGGRGALLPGGQRLRRRAGRRPGALGVDGRAGGAGGRGEDAGQAARRRGDAHRRRL
ncbi:MAG: diguanylate cyclase/phosphodiesterase (GGDEF & EAL domains) with PAS/PAC sensor(s), partial [uncultured Gemmatimonadaceae bacterium]